MRTAAEVGLALLGEETYQEETQKPERIDFELSIQHYWFHYRYRVPGLVPYLTLPGTSSM